MRLLVTRPEADAAPLAARLRAAGHEVLLASLLAVEFTLDGLPSLDDVAALIFTSANGVRAFAAASPRRDLPAYAVGDRTAAALAEAGFTSASSAAGDVDSLARLIVAARRPDDGALLHIAGSDVAGDLAGVLGEAGYRISRAVLYRTSPCDLDDDARAALRDRRIDGVLLFSPRTARAFAEAARRHGLTDALGGVTAWCLSAAVAHGLGDLAWGRVAIAETPTQDTLLALIEAADTTRVKEIDVSEVSPLPPPPRKPRRWPVYALIAALAVASGASTAHYWLPGPWEHHWGPPVEALRPAAVPAPSVEAAASPPQPRTPPTAMVTAEPVRPPAPVAATAAVSGPDPRLDRLAGEVADLHHTLNDLAARGQPDHAGLEGVIADQKSLAVSLATLQTRIAAIEKTLRAADTAASSTHALLLAAEQLRQDLASSAPYAGPFAVLATLGGKDPGIAPLLGRLSRHAATGIASRPALAQQLAALAETLAEPPPPAADAPWWRRLLDRVERLVVIRHVDGTAPATPDAIARAAAAELDQGDLDGAVARVSGLSGDAAATAAPWLATARDRLAAENAADSLLALLTSRLTTPMPLEPAP